MNENFAKLFEESIADTSMNPGSIIKAAVININSDYVTLNAGLKSEATVSINEFYNFKGELEVAVGDEVEVALDMVEDGFGETILSRDKAKRIAAWKKLGAAQAANENVTGMLADRVKGGFTVDIGYVRAFLPGSLVDTHPIRDLTPLEGKELQFKVIKMDQKRNNIVVSRRAVIEEASSSERQELLEKLHEGQEVKGVVKNLTDYGAFIDLGGIDGLLHITDISWKRVKHPSDILTIGQEVMVKVLSFDQERKRVSLGMKQLSEDPWQELINKYPQGSRLVGKVTNITDYGCFVEINDGIEGLVHMSEMDWTNKNVNPTKIVQLGGEVEIMVLEIDQERRRISLGMKQCVPNPWETFAENHNKGDQVLGEIRSITDFGIFIGLEGDIDGLVHITDISWALPGEQAVKEYKKGQQIETIVLGIDPQRERISLGIKQLNTDPFTSYVDTHGKGSIVKGKVVEVNEKAAVVELADNILAQLRAAEVSTERVEDVTQALKIDQEIEAKITNVDRKSRVISISIKAKDIQEENEMLNKYARNEDGAKSKAKLGDILKEKIGDKGKSD